MDKQEFLDRLGNPNKIAVAEMIETFSYEYGRFMIEYEYTQREYGFHEIRYVMRKNSPNYAIQQMIVGRLNSMFDSGITTATHEGEPGPSYITHFITAYETNAFMDKYCE